MVQRVRVTSQTDQSKDYVVTFVGDEPVACTCPSYHYRGIECKHISYARNVRPLTQAELVQVHELLRKV